MRRLPALIAVVVAASLSACGGSDPRPAPGPQSIGGDSFLSQPPGFGGGPRTYSAASDAGGAGAAGGAPVPAAAPETSGDAATATRAIEEADIYKRDGSLLYVLNSYRGLQIVDVANPAAPRLVSQVRVTGRPVDLYLRGQTALVAVSDAFAYYALEDGSVRPHRGSRVLAVNVTDPAHPAVASDLPIEGEVDQTRLVGDVLYVVSRKYAWYDWAPAAGGAGGGVAPAGTGSSTAVAPGGVSFVPGGDTLFVASFDLRDARDPRQVARVDFPMTGWDTHANVTPERVTLSFMSYDGYGPATQFRVVDISDPGGALRLGTSFAASGAVRDRWGMDYDAVTGLFRAVLNVGRNQGAALRVWSSPDVDTATPLSTLPIQVAESVTASRFDGDRVYVVTALQKDPLWVIDAKDPRNPRLVGEFHMPGQLEFIVPLPGDRLVALGHTDEFGTPGQLAVSLFDVSQLATPTQLGARIPVGEGWGSVAARPDDLHKAFIVLPPPPDGIGLVLVPFQGWDRTTYRYTGGTQLVDLGRDALTKRGFLSHPGQVTRSFPLDAAGESLAALSDSALQVIDARNRSDPRELARVDLARSVASLAIVHGKAVELSGDWSTGVMELVVTDALDPDAATPLARVDLAAPQARMLRDGDLVWLLAHDGSGGKSWMQGVDLRDPAHPVLRGRLDLAGGEAFSYGRSWGYGDEAVVVGHAIAVHHASWVCPAECATVAAPAPNGGAGATGASVSPTPEPVVPGELRIYDVSDPDHPRLASRVSPAGAAWAWGLTVTGNVLWLTHFEWDTPGQVGRYYLDRVDLSDPAQPKLLPKINVPGVFVAASPDGSRIYTLETAWYENRSVTWLHRLQLGATAVLEATVQLEGSPSGFASAGSSAWLVVNPGTYPGTSHLVAADLAGMRVTSDQAVQGSWAWLRAAAGGKLFLDGGWYEQGLLLYDLSDPARPTFDRFFRTPSWVSDVVVAEGRAYLPSGPYGVPVIELH